MKKLLIGLAVTATLFGSTLTISTAQPPPPPNPPPAGAPAAKPSHAQIEAALKSLNLAPRQKLEIARIAKNAKASNQDPLTTMEQIKKVLTPDQQAKLKAEVQKQMQAKKASR